MIASLVNGREESTLSILDRGLQFGDGLFETIAVLQGKPALWQQHMERLLSGCRQLAIRPPDPDLLHEEALRLVAGRPAGVLKIVLTRGVSDRGYKVSPDASPTRLLQLFEWSEPEQDREISPVIVCRQRLGFQPGYGGLKHLNRLEQVLARREFGEGEGLMLDVEGFLVEGVASNLFLVLEGELHTPIIDRCGVAGVVRRLVMDVAREMHRPVNVRRMVPGELEQAEGIFLTSSLQGIRPVTEIAGIPRQVHISHHPVMEEAARRVFSEDGGR